MHGFANLAFNEILAGFVAFRALAQSLNPDMRFLLTVSPVPLTATATDSHVLAATVRSRSVLRAGAAQLYEAFSDINYFPSFELLSTVFLGPAMFDDNRARWPVTGWPPP